jgi:uncharacterized Rmd1/YagE family protein
VPLLGIHAYGFAATFNLKELSPIFALVGETRLDKDRLSALGPKSAFVLAYDFGGVVFVGVEPPDRDRVVQAISKTVGPEPHPPLTEDFLLEVRPGASLEVQFDRVIVPEANLPVVDIVALVMAQSVAIDYYTEDVQFVLAKTDEITSVLQLAGRIPGRVGDLVKFIGSCIATRNGVISTLALFDKPDATWENEQLDRLWNDVRHMLELDERYRTLEVKLAMIQDNLVLLVDLSQQRRTLRLEVTVAILILFEIVVMIWQMVIHK